MPGLQQLFDGATKKPAREFAARALLRFEPERVWMPCAGRFAAATALVRAGYAPEKIRASDLSVFSTLIGFMADPRHELEELQLRTDGPVAPFVADAKNELEWAAGVCLFVKWAQIEPKNAYAARMRREIEHSLRAYRANIAGGLAAQVAALRGMEYDVADVFDECSAMVEAGRGQGLYVNPPGFKGGYVKQYGAGEEELGWDALVKGEFVPKQRLDLLDVLLRAPGLVLTYFPHSAGDPPQQWARVYAHRIKPGVVDYVLSNRWIDDRAVVDARKDRAPVLFPVYGEHEILPTSEVRIVAVDEATALYYRDLFVHRLAASTAERHFLLLIDGRVVTAFGLHVHDWQRGAMQYLHEVYGISISSQRYKRLGKLFMLLLTSIETRDWLLANALPSSHAALRPLIGMRTASPTQKHEGKTDRSVMKLVKREKRAGGFQLVYQTEWHEKTWNDQLRLWLSKWGDVERA